MTSCKQCAEMTASMELCPCFGEQECMLAPWWRKHFSSTHLQTRPQRSDGAEPKTASTLSPTCRSLRLEFSEDASLQDLYLILKGLSDGGFNVSVSVQATPASRRSPSDTAEPSTCWTAEGLLTEWLRYWAVLGKCSKDTTQSSRTSGR